MNIDIKDIITLDDNNEYIVVSKINYQNNTYYYLVDKNNNTNLKFCIENKNTGNSIIELEDKLLIQTLIHLFAENAKQFIDLENLNN